MKIPRFRSLYGRIFTIFWLTQLLVLIGVLVAQHYDPREPRTLPTYIQNKYQKMADNISLKMTSLGGDLNQNLAFMLREDRSDDSFNNQVNTGNRAHFENDELIKNQDSKWFFTSEKGQIINESLHHVGRPIRNFITLSDDPASPKGRLYGRRMLVGPFLIKDKQARAFLYVALKWRKALPFYIQLLDKPFQLLFVTMFISTPLLLWLAWAVSRPARRLQAAAERVRTGCFETDALLEKGPMEFRRAGTSFNQMVTAINQMLSGQQRLLSDISHELRSPLTRLRMANALAVRKQGQSSELARIDTEAERMEQMICDLLALSRMQIDSHLESSIYSVKTLWNPLLEDAQFEANQYGKTLFYSPFPNVKLEGNPSLLASGLENVVRNAIKYAEHEILIDFSVQEGYLSVSIHDDGEGVPKEMLTDIFRPFFRVSTARDRETGGTGLGLAITESAVRQHQGKLIASINEKGGLTVVLSFPLFLR